MEKITKKRFIETLAANTTVLLASVRRSENSEDAIHAALDGITEIHPAAPRRKVKEIHSNHVLFDNDSSIYFDQDGKKEYFTHKNDGKIEFIGQKHTVYDRFDEKNLEYYLIYAIA